jgi:hypothetical protein
MCHGDDLHRLWVTRPSVARISADDPSGMTYLAVRLTGELPVRTFMTSNGVLVEYTKRRPWRIVAEHEEVASG